MIQKVHDGQGLDQWVSNRIPGNRTEIDGKGTGYGETGNCGTSIGFGGTRHQRPRHVGEEAIMGMANIYGTGHGGG